MPLYSPGFVVVWVVVVWLAFWVVVTCEVVVELLVVFELVAVVEVVVPVIVLVVLLVVVVLVVVLVWTVELFKVSRQNCRSIIAEELIELFEKRTPWSSRIEMSDKFKAVEFVMKKFRVLFVYVTLFVFRTSIVSTEEFAELLWILMKAVKFGRFTIWLTENKEKESFLLLVGVTTIAYFQAKMVPKTRKPNRSDLTKQPAVERTFWVWKTIKLLWPDESWFFKEFSSLKKKSQRWNVEWCFFSVATRNARLLSRKEKLFLRKVYFLFYTFLFWMSSLSKIKRVRCFYFQQRQRWLKRKKFYGKNGNSAWKHGVASK